MLPTIFILQNGLRNVPHIYSILAKAAAFTILLLIFDIVEEVVVGKFKGKTFAESFPHVGDGSPRAFLYMIIIFAIALIPFFSFREIGRVFGEPGQVRLLLDK